MLLEMSWIAFRSLTGNTSLSLILNYANMLCKPNRTRLIYIVIIRHNDFPMTLHDYASNQVSNLDIYDLTNVAPWSTSPLSHTDIKRLRAGKVGAQVWFISPTYKEVASYAFHIYQVYMDYDSSGRLMWDAAFNIKTPSKRRGVKSMSSTGWSKPIPPFSNL